MPTTEEIRQFIQELHPDDVYVVIQALRDEHGLGILVMGRKDVAERWHRDEEAPVGEQESENPTITDLEWDTVRGTWAWRKGFSAESIMEDAWWLVDDAVRDAKAELSKK